MLMLRNVRVVLGRGAGEQEEAEAEWRDEAQQGGAGSEPSSSASGGTSVSRRAARGAAASVAGSGGGGGGGWCEDVTAATAELLVALRLRVVRLCEEGGAGGQAAALGLQGPQGQQGQEGQQGHGVEAQDAGLQGPEGAARGAPQGSRGGARHAGLVVAVLRGLVELSTPLTLGQGWVEAGACCAWGCGGIHALPSACSIGHHAHTHAYTHTHTLLPPPLPALHRAAGAACTRSWRPAWPVAR